ncbi:hypothetical protein ACTFIR_012591 [Dictyostelium discoideum]
MAVLMGATRLGLNTISTRKQTKMYINHILSGKSIIKWGDTLYCKNVCDVIVHANQMIGFDEVFTRPYVPTSREDQKVILFSIFSSDMPTISYTTDPCVKFLGHLFIDIPNVGAPVLEKEARHFFDFTPDEYEEIDYLKKL